MTAPRTIVLIPTFNEAGNLAPMLDAVRGALPDAHILVIDDSSPDGTGVLADRAASADPKIEVAHRPHKQGLGVAYRYGYQRALLEGFDFIIQMDCDFSHDPNDLPRLRALLDTHPAVIGSRRVPGGGAVGWPWYRNLVSLGGSLYARTVLASPVHDLTTGFKGFRRATLERLDLPSMRSDGFGFQIEVTASLLALGVPIHEMPIQFVDRKWGKSKMSTKIFVEAMIKVWQVRARAAELRER
ncbi:MAG: polyprenol monophosphomannose synthase [Polyangia bacterium]